MREVETSLILVIKNTGRTIWEWPLRSRSFAFWIVRARLTRGIAIGSLSAPAPHRQGDERLVALDLRGVVFELHTCLRRSLVIPPNGEL